MKNKRDNVELWPENYETGAFRPYLELRLRETDDEAPRGAVIVFPGGGYGGRAGYEGAPIAEFFRDQGFRGFVCQYRVSPNRHPAPLNDAARAIRLVRSKAAAWNVNPDKIAVLGFSAGAHLAGSSGVLYRRAEKPIGDKIDQRPNRPDAMVLCYPVITAKAPYGHMGSFRNLLGPETPVSEYAAFSLEEQVCVDTPPAFLWHTAQDTGVPPENSMFLASALGRHQVPYELHVFPEGRHGLGMAVEIERAREWPRLAADWLKSMGW